MKKPPRLPWRDGGGMRRMVIPLVILGVGVAIALWSDPEAAHKERKDALAAAVLHACNPQAPRPTITWPAPILQDMFNDQITTWCDGTQVKGFSIETRPDVEDVLVLRHPNHPAMEVRFQPGAPHPTVVGIRLLATDSAEQTESAAPPR